MSEHKPFNPNTEGTDFKISDHNDQATEALVWAEGIRASNETHVDLPKGVKAQLPKHIYDSTISTANRLRADGDFLGADIVLAHLKLNIDNIDDGK